MTAAATLGWHALLAVLLCVAGAWDVRTRRIPNTVVGAILLSGLARAAFATAGGPAVLADASAPGLVAGLAAAALGLAVALPLYAMRVMGAGDVKLFAAAAVWIGPSALPMVGWWTALIGGALAVGWMAVRALRTRATAQLAPTRIALPYGVAIAAGVLATVAFPSA